MILVSGSQALTGWKYMRRKSPDICDLVVDALMSDKVPDAQ